MADTASERPFVCLLRTPSEPDPYVAALEAAGYRAVCQPVLAFSFVNAADLGEALQAPEAYGGLLLTSPRAAEALAAAAETLDDLPGGWAEKPVFVVGPRTAEAVRRLGLAPSGGESGTAEALVDHVIDRAPAAPLLFLSGHRRRDVLPDRLQQAGVPIRELCVYETHLRADLGVLAEAAPDWLVFFSPSGVEAVQQAAGVDLRPVRKAAIGPTTAQALEAVGWAVDAVAEAPTPEAVVAALRRRGRGVRSR